MSKVVTNAVTLGQSGTETNNFLLDTDAAGSLRIRRKSDGSGGAVLTVSPIGAMRFPTDAAWPAFSAYQSTLQSIPNTGTTKLQFQTEEFDTANAYDNTTNYRFTPQVAGYYQVSVGQSITVSANAYVNTLLYKNGAAIKQFQQVSSGIGSTETNVCGSTLVYMNGTTDYLEVFSSQNGSGAANTGATIAKTFFQAHLLRAV